MGFTPTEIDEMSFWEFLAARDGWIDANTADDGKLKPPTPEEHDAMIAKYGG
jgi:hypothetical protein